MSITDAIFEEVARLNPQQRERVLEYVRSLASTLPKGAKLDELLQFSATIPSSDLAQMQKTIEENCEQVNSNGW